NRALTDVGLGAHAFGDAESTIEKAFEEAVHRTLRLRSGIGILKLTKDLGLTNDHRIKARRHSEQVPDRLAAMEVIEVRGDLLARHGTRAFQELLNHRGAIAFLN